MKFVDKLIGLANRIVAVDASEFGRGRKCWFVMKHTSTLFEGVYKYWRVPVKSE